MPSNPFNDVIAEYVVDPITPGTVVDDRTIKLDEASNIELEILQEIQSRENEIHNAWVSNYLPCELATLDEVSAAPKQVVDIRTTASLAINSISQQYAKATADTLAFQAENCINDVCGPYNRLLTAKVRSQSWQTQGELRYEEARVELQNADRLNNRIVMIAPGRNGLAQANSSLAAAAKMYGEIARQADAAKGGDKYALGRVLEFAKGNLGSLSKLASAFSQPSNTPQENFRLDEIRQENAGIGSDFLSPQQPDYQYDTGAELYGVDIPANVSVDVMPAPSFDTSGINGFI